MSNIGLPQYGWSDSSPEESHNYIFPKIQELIPEKKTLEFWMLVAAMAIWRLNWQNWGMK